MSITPPQRRLIEIAALLSLLGLSAYLRLANLSDNPGWYTDEGTHLDIARHLLEGRVQYLAITQSTLMFAKLPLFDLLLAATFSLVGISMTALRMFTGTLGVITVAAIYLATHRATRDTPFALLAAFMLAIYPQGVLYSRFGFSYNLLSPLVILLLLSLFEVSRTANPRWLWVAALAVGLGAVSDLLMLIFAVPVLIVAVPRFPRRSILLCLALMAFPLAIYSVFMFITAPHAFWFDARFTLFRVSSLSLPAQINMLALNYTTLIYQDVWLLAALLGLLILRPANLRGLALLLLLFPLVVLGRTIPLYSLSGYYLIPLFPLIALGTASLLRYGIPFVVTRLRELLPRWAAVCLALLLVIPPLLITTKLDVQSVSEGFHTPIDPFLINGSDARKAAAFMNALLHPSDVVIASPAVAWLIEGHTADFQMAVIREGVATPHLPADIPPDRFAFDPSFDNARFVIVDSLWHNWATFNVPRVSQMLERLTSWHKVFESGQIEVYENPAYP